MLNIIYNLFYISDRNTQIITLKLKFDRDLSSDDLTDDLAVELVDDWLACNDLDDLNGEFAKADYSYLEWDLL